MMTKKRQKMRFRIKPGMTRFFVTLERFFAKGLCLFEGGGKHPSMFPQKKQRYKNKDEILRQARNDKIKKRAQ
ncbi:MAG: hypothetical protein U9Q18_05850 [Caldisericota bacterium]|nr:hypothetical protein [Caldisericota bacterium]